MRPRPPRSVTSLVPLAALAGVYGGCTAEAASKQQYEFVIRIHGDPGRPLAGVRCLTRAKRSERSDARGTIALAANGREGETLAFEVHCPEGHRPPSKPLSIVLRRLSERDKRPSTTSAARR